MREQLVSVIMVFNMILLLVVFFFLNSYINAIIERYPPLKDCESMDKAFTD
jgi:hypothetical protein